MVPLVRRERSELLDKPDLQDRLEVQGNKELLEQPVQREPQVHLGSSVRQERLDLRDQQETSELLEILAILVLRDHLGHKVCREILDPKGISVILETLDCKEPKVVLVLAEPQVVRVLLALPALQVWLVVQDLKEILDYRG